MMSSFLFKKNKNSNQSGEGNEFNQNQPRISTNSYNEPLVSDTLSASVDLEDIIENYDGNSQRSFSASIASLSNIIQSSRTYFTANGATNSNNFKNDETTSFYSALQDGFSLSNFDLQQQQKVEDSNFNPNTNDLLWTDSADQYTEKDILMSPSDFQVYWNDLSYKIKPKITILNIWFNLEQRFKSSLLNVFGLAVCSRTKKYIINDDRNLDKDNSKSIYNRDEPITIIQHINGSFKSGELTAVMGPSGAGKTSLLNFLSRRREEGYNGELYVDTTSNRRIKISTIPQSDHLPEYLTVRENLTFASRLKNTHQINYDHDKNIERVSNLLGLDDCLDTRTKRISGGQHKRLAIAQELLSKPDILILDEPTSGLDSLTCYKTLTVLKNLVKASAKKLIDPIAIVLTIHQPQREVFDLFDKIYVMANNGIVIYNGPPDNCIEFIEKHTGIQLPDKDYNPASFLIEIASGEYGLEPIKVLENQVKLEFSQQRVKQKVEILNNNKSTLVNNKSKNKVKQQQNIRKTTNNLDDNIVDIKNINQISKLENDNTNLKTSLYIDHRIAKGSSINVGSFWLKTRILWKRCWFSILRDPKQMIGRILFHITLPIALALFMGTEAGHANACPKFKSEYQLKNLVNGDTSTDKNVQEELFLTLENIGLIFILMYALTCANIAATTLSFTLDMQSSLKEFYNGWYTMPSYIVARITSTLPMEIFFPIITLSLSYPLTGQMTGHGLSDTYRILITAGAIILGSMIGQTMGMILGAIYIGHVSTALFASQAITLPFVFLSGFVVRTKNMSKFVYMLSKTSFYKHTLDIAALARYGFDVCDCKRESISGKDAKIVGIPEKFNEFVKYWFTTFLDQSNENDETTTIVSSTTITSLQINETKSQDENDLFKMFAKQVSLYNTYGIDVKSCNDVKPFQLYDLGLTENDIPRAFLALLTLLAIIKILLIITVKLVIHYRTSL